MRTAVRVVGHSVLWNARSLACMRMTASGAGRAALQARTVCERCSSVGTRRGDGDNAPGNAPESDLAQPRMQYSGGRRHYRVSAVIAGLARESRSSKW